MNLTRSKTLHLLTAMTLLAAMPVASADDPIEAGGTAPFYMCESHDYGPIHLGIAVDPTHDTCRNECTGVINVVIGLSIFGDVHNCDG